MSHSEKNPDFRPKRGRRDAPSGAFRSKLYQQLRAEMYRQVSERNAGSARRHKLFAAGLAAVVTLAVLGSALRGLRPQNEGVTASTPGAAAVHAQEQLAEVAPAAVPRLSAAWKKVNGLYEKGRHIKAVRLCDQVLEQHAQTETLDGFLYVKAKSLMGAGKEGEAIWAVFQLFTEYPYSRYAEKAMEMASRSDPASADKLGAKGEPDIDLEEQVVGILRSFSGTIWQRQALDRFARHFPDHPLSSRAVLALGRSRLDQEDTRGAIRLFGQVVSHWPQSGAAAEAEKSLVYCYRRLGLLGRAAEECVAMLNSYPESMPTADALLGLANHLYSASEYEEAANWYDELTRRFPTYALVENVEYRIGQCYGRSEDFRLSAQKFEEFAREYPESVLRPKALASGGDAYLKARDTERARDLYQSCVAQYPNSIEAFHARRVLAMADSSTLRSALTL